MQHQSEQTTNATSRHDDASLMCSVLNDQLMKLERQTEIGSDLEDQHKAALQKVRVIRSFH